MKIIVTVTDAATYEFDDTYTEDSAISTAWDWFQERKPNFEVKVIEEVKNEN